MMVYSTYLFNACKRKDALVEQEDSSQKIRLEWFYDSCFVLYQIKGIQLVSTLRTLLEGIYLG